jgi:rare lipoprotein A
MGRRCENNKTLLSTASLEHKWLKTPANIGVFVLVLLLSACGTTSQKPSVPAAPTAPSPQKPGGYYQDDGPGENPPTNLEAIADAVPRPEPLHRGANRPYTVFGKSYAPNVANEPFRQSGLASWYGRKFHGQKTSIGETYDMYAMTAAHPTLPLPSYVRVTNPANNRSVIVRLNDRGPFHQDRVIDLSYVAAAKLDLIRRGSGLVTVERVFPGDDLNLAAQPALVPMPMPVPVATNVTTSPVNAEAGQLYLQLGAFSSAENAEIFRARMSRELTWNQEPIAVLQKDGLYRVRLGPYKSREDAERIAAQIRTSHDFSPVVSKP